MTVISSLFSGISGIVANGSALSVAGDNIANMSTPAFKSSVPVFESALSQRIGEAEVGLGARLAGTTANFSQGAFSNSTRATDLAIEGRGFFIVQNSSGDQLYTRAGSFETNSDGNLVTSAGGFVLQGYAIEDGLVSGNLSGINFQTVDSEPVATDEVVFNMNLDADTEVRADVFDGSTFATAASTSDFSYSQTIYDSLGNARTMTTYMRKTAANTWQFNTLTLGQNLSNFSLTSADAAYETGTVIIGRGTLTFDTDGTLLSAVGTDDPGQESLTGGTSGTNTQIGPNERISQSTGIQWVGADTMTGSGVDTDADLGLSIAHYFGQGSTEGAVTQYASANSSIKSVTQNGRQQGELLSIEVESDGTIRGNFSNGDARDLFKVPLATFANEGGLTRAGSNLYAESGTSGQAQTGLAASAGRGQVRAFSIEQSNVDLASEFVRIITFQRAFQASSRTVSTAAELLQDLVNLGR